MIVRFQKFVASDRQGAPKGLVTLRMCREVLAVKRRVSLIFPSCARELPFEIGFRVH